MQISVYDHTGKKQPSWDFDSKSLGTPNDTLLAQALRIYESNSHQGGSKVKTRGEVIGSTRKIYRQKGTGNARHGARYAPIFVGGGIAHGPNGTRAKNLTLPKKMRRKALATALLLKLKDAQLVGLSKLSDNLKKTSTVTKLLAKTSSHPQKRVLIVTDAPASSLYQGVSNLQGVTLKRASIVNAYDLVAYDSILLTKAAFESLVNRANHLNLASKTTNKNTK